jgi:hypothetical protein
MLLFTVTLFITCDYGFSEDYYKEIELKDPSFSFKFINFNNEEIFRNSKVINYEFKNNIKDEFVVLNFYLNGNRILSSNNYEGQFNINIDNLSEGKHAIKVEINVSTGSGSLVDNIGQEYYQKEESFNFTVDKSIKTIEVSNVEHRNGSIYISWIKPEDLDRYNEINLVIKETFRTRKIPLLAGDSIIKKEVYRDSLSLKFNIKYSIEAFNNYTEKESSINNFYVIDSLITIEHEFIDDENYKIKWNKHPLYNNFDHYELEASNITKKNIDNKGGEITITSSFIFGSSKHYSIKKERTTYIVDNETIYRTIPFGTLYDNQNYEKLIYDEKSGFIFGVAIDKEVYPRKIGLFKLNANDLSIIKKIEFENIDYQLTPDLIFDDDHNLVLDLREKSIIFNSDNLTVKEEFFRDDYNSSLENYITKVRYRNGLIILDNDYSFRDIYIYNAQTKQLITTLKKEYSTVISEDFQFFTVERNVYKIENNSISLLYSLPDDEPRFYDLEYLSSKNSLVLLVGGHSGNGKECLWLDLNTNTTSVIPGTNNTSYFNYDSSSDKILFVNRNSSGLSEVNVLNLKTNQMKSLKVANGYVRKYVFLNDYLILLKHDYFLKNRL